MAFGQIVLGPPGSGKSTYCHAMVKLLSDLGRKVQIVNLDPANDELPYSCTLNITDLVRVDDVMDIEKLGPNGALVYCMEFLDKNVDWLLQKLKLHTDAYFIFDLPGQAELYTHHTPVKNIMNRLQKEDYRLCSIFMVDAHYANDPGKYMSALVLTLSSMLQIESPTVNVLSKIDNVERFGKLSFGLDFYTEVLDLEYLVESLDEGPFTKKYKKLNAALAELVSRYSLVSFIPVSVEDRRTLLNVIKAVDKANGYVFGENDERNIQRLLSVAIGAESDHERLGIDREMFINENNEVENEEILKMIATQNVAKL